LWCSPVPRDHCPALLKRDHGSGLVKRSDQGHRGHRSPALLKLTSCRLRAATHLRRPVTGDVDPRLCWSLFASIVVAWMVSSPGTWIPGSVEAISLWRRSGSLWKTSPGTWILGSVEARTHASPQVTGGSCHRGRWWALLKPRQPTTPDPTTSPVTGDIDSPALLKHAPRERTRHPIPVQVTGAVGSWLC